MLAMRDNDARDAKISGSRVLTYAMGKYSSCSGPKFAVLVYVWMV